jgi:hypothetical protein
MKKIKKYLISFSIVSLSAVLVFQVTAIKTNSKIVPDINQPVIYQVKASANSVEKEALVEIATTISDDVDSDTKDTVTPAAIVSDSKAVSAMEPQKTVITKENAKADETAKTQTIQKNAAVASSEPKQIFPGIIYDEEKQLLYGPDGRGLLLIGYDYDLDQQLFYSAINPWQRNFGYNKLFDQYANLLNILFDTRCIYFNYNGTDWMIQLWRGIYGITSGAEVGIYTKSPLIPGQYDCASDENNLYMDLEVYKDGKLYFTRPAMYHWWQTGFFLGDIVSPNDLNIKSTITFKDQEMTNAFVEALSKDEALSDVYYTVNGINVSIDW